MRPIRTASGKAIVQPQRRAIQGSPNLSREERQAMVYATREWAALRRLVRNKWHNCVCCGRPAELVDHIIPVTIRPDLRFTLSNLQPLCRAGGCHDRKTNEIDAPGGFAHLYNYERAKTHADMRPEAMRQWARELEASGSLDRLLNASRISTDTVMIC